jgi:hypothetical protein
MNRKQIMAALVVVVVVVAAASLASADDWRKLGSKAIALKDEPVTVTVKAKDAQVEQISLKVSGSWVRVTRFSLNFSDGSSQVVETEMDVKPGSPSDPIAVEAGAKQLASVDITYEGTMSDRGGRATVVVLGS